MPFHSTDSEVPTLSSQQLRSSKGLWWLVCAAVATVVLWHVPGGNYILYPFTILATWFHEMAHGIMALLMGGRFSHLVIYANGSGAAYYSGPLFLQPIGNALVAAAGPLGPPLAGAGLILTSKNSQVASAALYALGSALLISTLVWIRSPFGIIVLPAIGLSVLVIAAKGSESVRNFAVQFLGVQACVSTYRQFDYLFSYSAGPLGISDTAQMQRALFLPYWFWGALIAAGSLLILGLSLRHVYRS